MRINYLLILSLILALFSSFVNGEVHLYNNCDEIQKNYEWGGGKLNISQNKEFLTAYNLQKKFTTGAGGASVYLISEKNNPNKKYILKIFKKEAFKQFNENREVREIYFTCKLAKLNFGDDKNIKFSSDDRNFFPNFYGYGFSNSDDPFSNKEVTDLLERHYFMLIEFVEGKNMFEVSGGEDGTSKVFSNEDQTRLIFYEIISALNKANKDMGFYHMDLHPGNIILSEEETVTMKLEKDLENISITAPKIIIIDFGLSTSTKFYKADKINVTQANSIGLIPSRGGSLVLLKFCSKMTPKIFGASSCLNESNTLKNSYPHGDDLQFINLMIYSFDNFYKNKFIGEFCTSYDQCQNQVLKNIKGSK